MNDNGNISSHSEVRRILLLHLTGVTLLGSGWALTYILPFLARKDFHALWWQTWLLTAAVPVMQFFTIFWNHLYVRISTKRYFLIISLLICVPLAAMAFANSVYLLIICFALAGFGGAGGGAALSPLNADLLRACYQEDKRGRVYGMVAAAQFTGVIFFGQTMGTWSDHDTQAFRIFLPLTAVLMGVGLWLLAKITGTQTFHQRSRPEVNTGEPWWAPLRDMGRTLREDRRFLNYETAFMLYGVGWMICTVLLPLIGQDKLRLDRADYATATVVTFQVTLIILLIPMGNLADRVGPVRLAAGSFLWLTIYPIGLLLAETDYGLGFVTVLYGLGMTGVHLTWTLGPVSFAADPSRAPQYLAIHGTLVGVRGILMQGVGVGLYALTGSFKPPLILAALGFAWASWRMRKLAKIKAPS